MVWRVIELCIWVVVLAAATAEALMVHGYGADRDDLVDDNTRLHERLDAQQWQLDMMLDGTETRPYMITDLDQPTPEQFDAPTRPDFRVIAPPTVPFGVDADKYGRHAATEPEEDE